MPLMVSVPGLYFGKSVQEAVKDTLWNQLIESGTIWFDCEPDEEMVYPNCEPRHRALMDRVEKSHESARRKANCRACYARHGERVRDYCGTCFWNPAHDKEDIILPCPNCMCDMAVHNIWEIQDDGSFIIMRGECDCGAFYNISGQDSSKEAQ